MTTCSFLCQTPIVDHHFYTHLQRAVFALVREHDEIEFIFRQEHGAEKLIIFCALLEAKQAFLDKRIHISLCCSPLRSTEERFLNCVFPDYMYYRIYYYPFNLDDLLSSHSVSAMLRADRWLLRQTDYVISYWYPDLQADNQAYRAVQHSRAKIIHLTQPETLHFIHDSISRLSPEQQETKILLLAGVTQKALCEEYHVSKTTMTSRIYRISKALREFAVERMQGHHWVDVLTQPMLCSVLLESISESYVPNIRQTVQIMLERFWQPRFYLPRRCSQALEEIMEELVPPPALYRFDDAAWADMIAVSDCVICAAA